MAVHVGDFAIIDSMDNRRLIFEFWSIMTEKWAQNGAGRRSVASLRCKLEGDLVY